MLLISDLIGIALSDVLVIVKQTKKELTYRTFYK